jgi:hypothetical protein
MRSASDPEPAESVRWADDEQGFDFNGAHIRAVATQQHSLLNEGYAPFQRERIKGERGCRRLV